MSPEESRSVPVCTPARSRWRTTGPGHRRAHRRISALAGAGEVLVRSTVRDLVVGSSMQFEDRGLHELKGVPDPWRVLALLP